MMKGFNNEAGSSSSSHGHGNVAPGTTVLIDPPPFDNIPLHMKRSTDLLFAVSMKAPGYQTKLVELARSAMFELSKKAQAGAPLWKFQVSRRAEVLDEGEYVREFRAFDASIRELLRLIQVEQIPGVGESFTKCAEFGAYRSEASRSVGLVNMKADKLAELLMDFNRWSSIFCGVLSSPVLLGVVPMGSPGNNDEALQVIRAGFQMATPLVNVRDCPFLRYRKQISPGLWGIAEVSIEKVFSYPLMEFRRRASGCLIFDMPDGRSKVTWVEHVEIDNTYAHQLFKPFVFSGLAFGAHRFVAAIVRYSHLLSTIFLDKTPTMLDGKAEIAQRGKESLISLSQRMIRIFLQNISPALDNNWVRMNGCKDVDARIMAKRITLANGIPRTALSFSTALSLPLHPRIVFQFLQDFKSRSQWDILSFERVIHELLRIVPGGVPENRISIIKARNAQDLQKGPLYLQESFTDSTGLYVVYAPVDALTLATLLNGANPEMVSILPSGFVVHPDRPVLIEGDEGKDCQSVVTIAFNIIDDASTEHHVHPESVDVARKILEETASEIEAGVLPPPNDDDDDEGDDYDDEDEEDHQDEDDDNNNVP